jgi:CheY-like chemotaxis protein
VILLDIGLPDFDGYRIARHVRLNYGNSIYIAAVTGWGQREDRDRALEAGIDEHFTKPVDSAVLLDMLARAAKPRA